MSTWHSVVTVPLVKYTRFPLVESSKLYWSALKPIEVHVLAIITSEEELATHIKNYNKVSVCISFKEVWSLAVTVQKSHNSYIVAKWSKYTFYYVLGN